ncbi:MAG TPA: GDP-mannose 4,6-dehydratase [Actinoplanes sp.]|jgi:dTDP-glucose 4,6-dehydratase
MNLLVTGGAGFIGSHFVRAVLADRLWGLEGASVTVVDKLTYAGSFASLGSVAESERLSFVPGDICDAAVVDAAVRGHDAVVHFAAESDTGRSVVAAGACAMTNVGGTQLLLDAAVRHGTGRFVQASTARVYGPVPAGAVTEDAPLNPTSGYAASKAGADLAALACHRTHGLPVMVTRASDTYGPRQHPEKTIPRILTHLLAGRTVSMAGDGGRVRDWLHVHDHCQAVALVLLAGRPGDVYHVAGTAEIADRDLAGLLLDACVADPGRVVWDGVGAGQDRRHALDDDKIRRELGWRPGVEFDAGLDDTMRWYRDNLEWWLPRLLS